MKAFLFLFFCVPTLVFAASQAELKMESTDDPNAKTERLRIILAGDLTLPLLKVFRDAHKKDDKKVTLVVSGAQKSETYTAENIQLAELKPFPTIQYQVNLEKEEWFGGWSFVTQQPKGMMHPATLTLELTGKTAKTMFEVMELAGVKEKKIGDAKAFIVGGVSCTEKRCRFEDPKN